MRDQRRRAGRGPGHTGNVATFRFGKVQPSSPSACRAAASRSVRHSRVAIPMKTRPGLAVRNFLPRRPRDERPATAQTGSERIVDETITNPGVNPLALVTDGGGLDRQQARQARARGQARTRRTPRLSRRGRVIDQHRGLRHLALEEIIAAPIGIGIIGPIAAITRHDEPLPVALEPPSVS